MADEQATESTPIVASTANSTPTSTEELKWYHYLYIALLGLFFGALFLSSLSSVWGFIFINGTILILADAFYRFILPLKPDVVKVPFLVSHTAYTCFVSSLLLFVSVTVIYIGAAIVEAILIAIAAAIFAAFYPDAMQVFSDDMTQMSAYYEHSHHFSHHVRAASVSMLPRLCKVFSAGRAVMPVKLHHFMHHFRHHAHHHAHMHAHVRAHVGVVAEQAAAMPDNGKYMFDKVWTDMIQAGASPVAMWTVLIFVALSAFFIFVLLAGVLATGALEYVKWNAFKRHRSVPGVTSVTDQLGVKGTVFIAAMGAFFICAWDVASTGFAIVPTFYNGVIFLCGSVLDTAVIVGAMVMVATTYAEKEILGKEDVSLKRAFKRSILYTFFMYFLRVTPMIKGQPDVTTPVFFFVLLTAIRAAIAWKKTNKIYSYFTTVADETPSSA